MHLFRGILLVIIIVSLNANAQTDTVPSWEKILQQMVDRDSVPVDSIVAVVNRIKANRNKTPETAKPVVANIEIKVDSARTFEERFNQALSFKPRTLDSIEDAGITSATKNAKQKAMEILDEEVFNKITFVYGFAFKVADFNFFLPKITNDYRVILAKNGLSTDEDKRSMVIKFLHLADTMPDHIVTRKELIEVNKKVAALVSKRVNNTDTLCYKRIPVPADGTVRELMDGEKSQIELLPGGFKTSYRQKLLLERRIAELRDTASINKADYEEILKRASFKLDVNRDRILTEDEVRNGVMLMKVCP